MSRRNVSMKEIVSTARRREGMRVTLKAAMAAWAGHGILVLLFLASLAYVALGGTLALEASPVAEAETPMAASLLADVRGALLKEDAPVVSGTEER